MSIKVRLVDTVAMVDECIQDLTTLPPLRTTRPSIAVDVEGVRLNRTGKICIVQLRREGSDTIWLLDITTLRHIAFDRRTTAGWSIRGILERTDIRKLFYDVRNDADALFNIYNIDMHNVLDLQLFELAGRHSRLENTLHLNGLGRSVDVYVMPDPQWKTIKDEGLALFSPERGGSYEVLERRPLDRRMLLYYAHNVVFLHTLEAAMRARLGFSGSDWDKRVLAASKVRLDEAKAVLMPLQGPHRALAPSI